SGAGEEPEQVDGALEGGARVCGDEAEVRICEATLSRTEEECHPTVRGVRAGESVLGAEKTVALGTGLARERRLLITGEPPKQAEDRKKPFHSVANKARRVYYGAIFESKKKFRLRRKPCRISPGLSLGEPPRSQPLLCTTFPTTT